MKRLCVYCGKDKEEVEFSDEHVLPQAIGGNLPTTNPFLLRDVCERCNNLCGLFVDGPFLKSWITQNDKALHALVGANLGLTTILPLTYIGRSLSCTMRTERAICG
jgi:HNH endonuclease